MHFCLRSVSVSVLLVILIKTDFSNRKNLEKGSFFQTLNLIYLKYSTKQANIVR